VGTYSARSLARRVLAAFVVGVVVAAGPLFAVSTPAATRTAVRRSTRTVSQPAPVQRAPTTTSSSANLFSGDQSSFDGGTGSWVPYTPDVAISDVPAPTQSGAGALSVTTGGSGPVDVWLGSGPIGSGLTPATPGNRYTGGAFVQGATIGRSVVAVEAFFNASMTAVGTVFGQAIIDTPGGWAALPRVVGIAPSGSVYVAYGLIFYGTAQGETHYVDTTSLVSTTAPTSVIHAPLHTSGNKIIQGDGTSVVLRGVNRPGSEWSTPEFPTDAEIGQIRAWGATVVRVLLNESLWVNTCSSIFPSNDTGYPGKVDTEVQSITSRGMVALLDLHFNVTSQCGTAGPQAMADAGYAPTFWSQVAARYAKNGLVAFDLYNEPHDIGDSVWRNGGTTTYRDVSFTASGMQQLYNAVRARAPSNLVFATGLDWGDSPPASPLTGTNIVYAIHDYTCTEVTPPGCIVPDPYNAGPALQHWTAFAATVPVMVTEFGWPNRFDGTFAGSVIAGAEARGWGWAAFAFDRGLFGLVASIGATYEPAPAGMPVVAGLFKN